MADASVKGFVLNDIEPFLENINKILNQDLFVESED